MARNKIERELAVRRAASRMTILDWEFKTCFAEEAYRALMKLRSSSDPDRSRGYVSVKGIRIHFRRLYLKY